MIAIIDNYDSFTYNVVDCLGSLGATNVRVVRNDVLSVEQLAATGPACIVISSGPGRPETAGISCEVVRRLGPHVPTLGICLGHQAIAEAFGGLVRRARSPRHGKTSPLAHNRDPLFAGIPCRFRAMRYHSLVVDPAAPGEGIMPIAWSLDDHEVMAVRHERHPIWGVQFHPESIGTPTGRALLGNLLDLALVRTSVAA